MPDTDRNSSAAELRFRALPRWDNEGGSVAATPDPHLMIAALTPAELIQLRIRTIALENMLIAVLAEGSDRQLAVAREMAEYIAPRPGFTHHLLTIEAGRHMTSLVDRAVHFRTIKPQYLAALPPGALSTLLLSQKLIEQPEHEMGRQRKAPADSATR